jgi:fatty acid desaturase
MPCLLADPQPSLSARSAPSRPVASDQILATTPSRDWFVRTIIAIVIAIWAAGAVAQILMPRIYSEPWWIHAIALCTVSYALTGNFVHSRLLAMIRDNLPTSRS